MPQEIVQEMTQTESTTNSGLKIDSSGNILASGGTYGSPAKRMSTRNSAAKLGEISQDGKRRLF